MRRVIVVGASSGIGASLVRALATSGWRVVAVARRGEELEALCGSFGPEVAHALVHDVRDLATVAGAFGAAVSWLGGLDAIVYSAGVMPDVAEDEYDTEKDAAIFEVNTVGAVAWLNEAARHLQPQGSGTLVGIGSVAGDRGRFGNPAYGASKAALHAWLESARIRLSRKGVRVLTIKPGPVRTPMTAHLGKLPLVIEADEAAAQIVAAMEGGRLVAYVPRAWAPIMSILKAIPSFVFRRLTI